MATKVSKPTDKQTLSVNNYIIVATIITVIVVLVAGLISNSVIRSVIRNSSLISHKQQAKSDLDTKLQNIPVLIQNYKDLGTKKQLIADALPSKSDFPQIVNIMQNASVSAGVQLKSVDPSSTTSAAASTTPAATSSSTSPTSPQQFGFTVSVAGTYAQVVQFMKNLELSARPMKVVAGQFQGDNGNVTVSAQVITYFQSPAEVNDKTEVLK